MASKRKKRYKPDTKALYSEHDPHPQMFQTLLSTIEAPEGLKSPLLKSLYYLIIHLSSNQKYCLGKGADMNELVMQIGEGEVRVTFKDICKLSDILFKELYKQLKQLSSATRDVSASMPFGLPRSHPDMWATTEELSLLLRCCMIVMTLPVPQEHILENGRVLLLIFKKLSLLEFGGNEKNVINFEELLSRERTYIDKDCAASFTEENVASLCFLMRFDPCFPFLSAIFEVFLDELLVQGQLRKYFQMINSLSPTSERLFVHDFNHGDFGIVVELISTLFLLSISDELAIKELLNKLTWMHGKSFKAPDLSLMASTELLLNPIMLSAPNLVQAYMISLVSDAIGIGMGCESLKPDLRLIDCYLSAFKSSVILYTQHMSKLEEESNSVGARGSLVKSSTYGESFRPSFESYIEPNKRKKLDHLMTKLNDSWHSHLRSMFFRTKSDLVTSSIAYIQESQHILDIACRDDILSFLSCIVVRAAIDVNGIALPPDGDTSLQDICLLASLLKLMSSSLIQTLWCIRHSGDLHCLKTLKTSLCKEYDFIAGIISCFKEFSIRLPIQTSLNNMMETHPMKHSDSKLMLLHFLGLLSLSFVSGLDFLVKGCILTIMALMNLFVFEEDNLDALKSITESRLESVSSGSALANVQVALAGQNSTRVASKFQKIQTLYLSTASVASHSTGMEDVQSENLSSALAPDNMECSVGIEETCSGKIYLKNVGLGKLPDFDDLADFIECKKGKDYSGWLRDREKFRKWKFEKTTKRRWDKKKAAWKYLKGKKT